MATAGEDCAVRIGVADPMESMPAAQGPSTHAVVYLPVFVPPPGVTRRAFLKAAVAGVALPSSLFAQTSRRETLYNGIVLPSPWPPRRGRRLFADRKRRRISCRRRRSSTSTIGRQLFVDDFLIEESSLLPAIPPRDVSPGQSRAHAAGAVGDVAIRTPINTEDSAEPVGNGVQRRRVLRSGRSDSSRCGTWPATSRHTALATSRDGVTWQRPRLDVVPGTNIVWPHGRDSNTVWLDHDAGTRESRYKMASLRPQGRVDAPAAYRPTASAGAPSARPGRAAIAARSSAIRFARCGHSACAPTIRQACSATAATSRSTDFAATRWTPDQPVPWIGADTADPSAPRSRHAPRALQPRRGRLRKRDARPLHDLPRRADGPARSRTTSASVSAATVFTGIATSREPFISRLGTRRRLELGERAISRRRLRDRRRPSAIST